MIQSQSGIYAWGGPGTIRLLKVKYHQPVIDEQSYLSLYDEARLLQMKNVLGVSDAWVTFSWGFSDQTEQPDYAFIQEKLPTFKALGIRTHGYVQGFNVVTAEFRDQDIFCRDPFGRLIPYSKGRSLTCPSNPAALAIIEKRVTLAAQSGFDGVFVDNILFGIPPSFIRSNFAPFFGCYCRHCQKAFQEKSGYALPLSFTSKAKLYDYLRFRVETMTNAVKKLSAIAHRHHTLFGVNLFDPCQINPEVYQGYTLASLMKHLDYLLIENHSLPSRRASGNRHLVSLIKNTTKPVFVVSYDQGIGYEGPYRQVDFDSIYTESQQLGYRPCYKVSEFTTHNHWQTQEFSLLKPVHTSIVKEKRSEEAPVKPLQSRRFLDPLRAMVSNCLLVPLITLFYNNGWIFNAARGLHQQQLRAWRSFEIQIPR